jgi:hypothetical protein
LKPGRLLGMISSHLLQHYAGGQWTNQTAIGASTRTYAFLNVQLE